MRGQLNAPFFLRFLAHRGYQMAYNGLIWFDENLMGASCIAGFRLQDGLGFRALGSEFRFGGGQVCGSRSSSCGN